MPNESTAPHSPAETLPIETTAYPAYWSDALLSGTDAICQAVDAAGSNRSAFLFYTDSHWNDNAQVSPVLLTYLAENTPLSKVFFGGDIVQDEPTEDTLHDESIMRYLWDWRSAVAGLNHYSVAGNHDDGNTTNNIFSLEYVYNYLFAPEDNDNIVRGGSTYYYLDDTAEQTRYLFLDTACERLFDLSAAQADFIRQSLISTPANWHIVVVAHAWYEAEYDKRDGNYIPVGNLSTSALDLAAILDCYNTRSGAFENCNARVEFCVGGHVHQDYVGATPGGIPIILFESDSEHVRSNLDYAIGTTSEAAVSGVVANYTEGTITVVRVGRGSSFVVPLSPLDNTPDAVMYTNLLSSAGYQRDLRLKGSTGQSTENNATDVTGFIPVRKGDAVYLKNIIMPDVDAHYYALVCFYDANQMYLAGYYINSDFADANAVYDEAGNLIQFTVPIDADYIRISARMITDASVITVNEKID